MLNKSRCHSAPSLPDTNASFTHPFPLLRPDLKALGLLLEASATALGNLVFRHPGNQARAAVNGTLTVLLRVLGAHFLTPSLLEAGPPGSPAWDRFRSLVRDVGEVESKLDIDDRVQGARL